MNLLYLSCHSIAEYEELKMFSELGITCISQGTYNDPNNLGADVARPKLDLPYFPDLNPLAKLEWITRIDPIPAQLIDWADVIYMHGIERWLPVNWERIKRKHVVFRCNGQSVAHTESVLGQYRPQGLKVVRYSPYEEKIPGYCGADALIRFYKDEDEYKGWTGEKQEVVTVAQSMKVRDVASRYSVFEAVTRGLPRRLYGNGNNPKEESWWVGPVSYEELKRVYRENRVYFYTCTFPAQYTMNFMEAWMTGIPVVAIGPGLAGYRVETEFLIDSGYNGVVSDDGSELRSWIEKLLYDPMEGKRMGEAGRKTAVEYFGKDKIKAKWKRFFDSL